MLFFTKKKKEKVNTGKIYKKYFFHFEKLRIGILMELPKKKIL